MDQVTGQYSQRYCCSKAKQSKIGQQGALHGSNPLFIGQQGALHGSNPLFIGQQGALHGSNPLFIGQ
jgi:hypothetical protein